MRFFVKFISVVALLLLFNACQKENVQDVVPTDEAEITLRNDETRIGNTFERNRNVREARPMRLGRKRTNPYTVEVMTKAWNNIAPNARLNQVPTTDLYVKFSPTDFDQLAILDELDIELFDHPLDYTIVQDGDYYIAEGRTDEDIPEYYAVVPPNFTAPTGVAYEVLNQLHLADYDTYLAREAFRMTENNYAGNPIRIGIPESIPSAARLCPEEYDESEFPSCLCDEYHIIGTPEHQDCMDYYNANDPTNPDTSTPTLNDCDCPVSRDRRHPAGRVTVQDTQLGVQPVRNVRIVARDNWFKVRRTWTDDNGCWHINSSYSGKANIKIRFKSDRITVRGIRGARLWEYAFAVRDRFTWNGPDFNDMCVNFMPNDDVGSPAKKYWYAAHANNALYEFDEYATNDGVVSPPDDMEILLANYNTAASAPMLNQLTKSPLIAVSAWGLTSSAANYALDRLIIGTLPYVDLAVSALSVYFVAFLPDVYYGYGGENNEGINPPFSSDRVKSTFYHEYAHANHFAALPNQNNYWLLEIGYIIDNGAYGDGFAPGAERAAVVEMWGDFIGVIYADREYGLNHGLAVPGNLIATRQRRFIYRAGGGGENHTPVFPIPFDDQDDWIPWGLFTDCIDDTAHNGPPLNINDPVTDNVQDYTISDCFDAVVTGSPITLNEVEQNLINNLPTGQNAADVNLLFQEYGY